MIPSAILLAALARLARKGGWCQGGNYEGDSPKCSMQAMARAKQGFVDLKDAECRYLNRVIGPTNIIYWNDTPGRTQTEVLKAFSDAARLAISEGR